MLAGHAPQTVQDARLAATTKVAYMKIEPNQYTEFMYASAVLLTCRPDPHYDESLPRYSDPKDSTQKALQGSHRQLRA